MGLTLINDGCERRRRRPGAAATISPVSDDWLQLLPVDPAFLPDVDAAEAARMRLHQLVEDADEVLATVSAQVAFIDTGEHHERITCPACGTDVDEGWWVRALDAAGERGFAELDVVVPCCRARLSLDALVYVPPAGFARFVLEARNPAVDELEPEQLTELASLLGTDLRVVRTHL
jgi:hypothetical protein